jgi:hypothetical protein
MSTEELPQSIDPTVTAPMADAEPQTAGGNVHLRVRAGQGGVGRRAPRWLSTRDAAAADPAPRTAF